MKFSRYKGIFVSLHAGSGRNHSSHNNILFKPSNFIGVLLLQQNLQQFMQIKKQSVPL